MSTFTGTANVMSLAIPVPTRSQSHTWQEAHSRSETPPLCSSYSDASSTYSDVDTSAWSPAGVYVPLHRRTGSGLSSSTASTAPTSVASSPRLAKHFLPLLHQLDANPKPQPHVYSREELLALAPSSLVYTSLHPTITPALINAHPRILRARGDGIARALDMARTHASVHTAYTHPVGPQLQSAPSPSPQLKPQPQSKPQLQSQPQAVRRRDRRRLNPRQSKSAPRRQLDMTRSWRAPQTVVA